MKFKLLLCAIFCFSTIAFVECKCYNFTGNKWNNELKKCGMDSEKTLVQTFGIGTLAFGGLKYEDINSRTKVRAYGDLKARTFDVSTKIPNRLQLKKYEENENYKQFSGQWDFAERRGEPFQIIKIELTVKFLNNGEVELINYVHAGSWWAGKKCAEIRSYVNNIEIIN